MFEQVSAQFDELLEGLEVPPSGDALVWAFSFMDRFRARVLDAVGGFDGDGAWRDSGATSMTAWLRINALLSSKEAGRTSRSARRLDDLPVTIAAYLDGSLSGGQLEAVVACLTDALIPEFAEAEAAMVPGCCRCRSPRWAG